MAITSGMPSRIATTATPKVAQSSGDLSALGTRLHPGVGDYRDNHGLDSPQERLNRWDCAAADVKDRQCQREQKSRRDEADSGQNRAGDAAQGIANVNHDLGRIGA